MIATTEIATYNYPQEKLQMDEVNNGVRQDDSKRRKESPKGEGSRPNRVYRGCAITKKTHVLYRPLWLSSHSSKTGQEQMENYQASPFDNAKKRWPCYGSHK